MTMILGISGRQSSGKSTFARWLYDRGFQEVSFADPMKRVLQDWFQFSDDQLWGSSEYRDRPDCRYKRIDGQCLSARYALQQLGTEWGRACYPNIWVDLALKTARTILADQDHGVRYLPDRGLFMSSSPAPVRGIVFSDVRFPNEVKAIQAAGGRVVRLLRGMPTEREWLVLRLRRALGLGGVHASEWDQLAIPDRAFDHVIDNRTISVADFKDEMEACLTQLG